MAKHKLTAYEQETIVTFNNSEREMNIYSCSPREISELKELCKKYPDHYKIVSQDKYSIDVVTDKDNIRFKKPRTLSQEHKDLISKNLKEYREQSKNIS
jgi:hypothetical protein